MLFHRCGECGVTTAATLYLDRATSYSWWSWMMLPAARMVCGGGEGGHARRHSQRVDDGAAASPWHPAGPGSGWTPGTRRPSSCPPSAGAAGQAGSARRGCQGRTPALPAGCPPRQQSDPAQPGRWPWPGMCSRGAGCCWRPRRQPWPRRNAGGTPGTCPEHGTPPSPHHRQAGPERPCTHPLRPCACP